MEGWRVHEDHVMNCDLCAIDEAEEPRILSRVIQAREIALTVNGASCVGREDLDVGAFLNYDRIAAKGAIGSESYEAINLHGPV